MISNNDTLNIPRVGMVATVRNRRGVISSVRPWGQDEQLHFVDAEYNDGESPLSESLLGRESRFAGCWSRLLCLTLIPVRQWLQSIMRLWQGLADGRQEHPMSTLTDQAPLIACLFPHLFMEPYRWRIIKWFLC